MLEIIIFAIIAFFLFKKLKDILGEEHDVNAFGVKLKNGKKNNNSESKTGAKPGSKLIEDAVFEDVAPDKNEKQKVSYLDESSNQILFKIYSEVNDFDLEKFIKVVQNVISLTIDAYNKKDLTTISKLTSASLFNTIKESINENGKNENSSNQNEIRSLISAKIINICSISEKFGFFYIQFNVQVEQLVEQLTRKSNNEQNSNSEQSIKHSKIKIEEKWTFSKKIDSKSINWQVEEIES